MDPITTPAGNSAPNSGGAPGAQPPAGGTNPPATPPAGGAPPAPWYGSTFQKESSRALVEEKKWKTHDDLADAYINAQQHMGYPPEQAVRIANEKDVEGRRAMYRKLGAPETIEGYGIQPGEGDDAQGVNNVLKAALENGLAVTQAKAVLSAVGKESAAAVARQAAALDAKTEADYTSLKNEWRDGFDANEEIAGKAMAFFLGKAPTNEAEKQQQEEFVEAMSKSLGYGNLMKRMLDIGKMLGEHRFIQDGQAANPNRVLSPADAEKELQRFMSTPDLVERKNRGEKEALDRWNHLVRCKAAGKPDIRLG